MISFMLIMPHTIENSTMGTTMNLSRLTKMVPMGLINFVANAAPPETPMRAQPNRQPRTNAMKIQPASEIFFLPVDIMFAPRIT